MAVVPVVSSDGMTAEIRKPVLVCDVCGFEWIRRGKLPDRCASQKCRSALWNRGKKAVAEWQKKERKPGRPRKAKPAKRQKKGK